MSAINMGELWVTLAADDAPLEAAAGNAEKVLKDVAKNSKVETEKVRSNFEKNFKGAAKSVKDTTREMDTNLKNLMKVMRGGAIVAAAGMAASIVSSAVSSAAAISLLSREAGLNNERFQELTFTMRSANMTQEQTSQIPSTLARNMLELNARTGAYYDTIRAGFPQLYAQLSGVRNTSDALNIIADAVRNATSEYDRMAIVQASFGQSNRALIDVFRNGREGLQQNAEEARRLGVVLTDLNIRSAAETKRRFDQLVDVVGNQFRAAVVGAARALGLLSADTTLAGRVDAARIKVDQLRASVESYNERLADANRRRGQLVGVDETRRLNNMKNLMTEQAIELGKLTAAQDEYNALLREQQEPDRRANEERVKAIANARAFAQTQRELNEAFSNSNQILENSRLPWENLVKVQIEIDRALRANAISAAVAAKAHAQAGHAIEAAYASAMGNIGANLESAFQGNKMIAGANALISTYEAYNKALAIYGPTPWGYAAAGAAIIAGIAKVRAIASTSSKGGGSGAASAGSGAGSAPPEMAPQQQSRSVHIQGVDPASLFSGKVVEGLISAINDEVQNGATLISTRNIPV